MAYFAPIPAITIEQVESYLVAMENVGLIVRYEAAGDMWQYWPEFRQNQPGLRADRETPEYPPPPNGQPAPIPPDDGSVPDDCRQDTGEWPAEENLSEVNSSERNTNGADAPPTNLAGWQKYIQDSPKNRPAALVFMHNTLYPGRDPPDYGYIGRTAKTVGGAGRLAALMWEAQAHHPDGDVLRYCMGMAKNRKGGKSSGKKPSNLEQSLANAQQMEEEESKWQP